MKYKLTNNTKEHLGKTLFQIEATASFGSVSKGELGGYIEKENNLSQEGDAWVSENAQVYGDAQVFGDARVFGNAWVSENAWVSGNAWVSENARVSGNAQVYGRIKLTRGYFFGWKEKEEELTFIDNDEDNQLIGKGDCKFEYYDEKPDDAIEEAIELLQRNGYKIIKSDVR